MTWWDSLDEYLSEREEADAAAPDPWASVDLGEPSLTDEQIAYLAFDQPAMPRLVGLNPPSLEDGSLDDASGDGTGNSPGDG
jgi:hypothetical protein